MANSRVNLSEYDNSWFKPGSNILVRSLWYYTNACFFRSRLFPFIFIKPILLRLFGAKVGQGVIIKPGVNIKYPWKLSIGDFAWIGEEVWIDNLEQVTIGKSACLSQGSFLLTGNHDYTSRKFELMVKEIIVEEAAWIGAKAIVCPGVICKTHSVLSAGAVATKNLEAYSIYAGVPAIKVKERILV